MSHRAKTKSVPRKYNRVRPYYYSISVDGEDCNDPAEVHIMKHDNAPGLSDLFLDEEFNHFKLHRDAVKARKKIIEALANL